MNAQRLAGWTAVVAGVLFIAGAAVASFSPLLAAPGAATATSAASCTETGMIGAGHMGGMTGADHMGGMMGSSMGACPGAGGTGGAPIPGAEEIRVRASNFAFSPSVIRLPKSDAVNLTLENPAGTGVVHDFTVPALGIHVAASSGQTMTIGLRGLAAGTYDAHCAVPGHADLGMRARVIVG